MRQARYDEMDEGDFALGPDDEAETLGSRLKALKKGKKDKGKKASKGQATPANPDVLSTALPAGVGQVMCKPL
jgi:hypothetical protein